MLVNKTLTYINSKLKNIIEQDHFIYDKGVLYCIREECQGCKHLEGCEFDLNNKLEETINKSTRVNIKFGKIINKTDWYLPHIEETKDLKYVHRVNGRYIPKIPTEKLPTRLKKRLALSESFKNVHKKIVSIHGIRDYKKFSDFILYNPEDREYYCIKTSCHECDLKTSCEPVLVEKDRELLYVAIDSASQEPEIVTYLSQEPQYVKIFVNHSLTSIDYLLEPLNTLFETKYGIDTNKDKVYHSFVDYLAFEDKTLLYNYCTAYYKSVKKLDIVELEESVKPIIAKYSEFKKLVKIGKIYIKT